MQRAFHFKAGIASLLILAVISGGCALNRKVPPPTAEELAWKDKPPEEGKAAAEDTSDSKTDRAETPSPEDKTNITEESLAVKEVSIEEGVPIEEEAPFALENIYFEFDRADLDMDARSQLEAMAKWMEKDMSIKIRIEGHADERGTSEYNLALADRRANAVKKYLAALGIESDRLKAISYGEEMPEVSGHNEAAWAKNRRVHFETR